MPTPAPDQLAKLRADTLAAGAAFIDDLQHLRAMLAAEAPAKDDIRRASLALRRLFVDGEIRRLAAPRLGRLHFDVPDNVAGYYTQSDAGFGHMVMWKPDVAKAKGNVHLAELEWAYTLTHEFTHAFVARYRSNGLVPRTRA